jgi:predicted permease
VRWSFDFRQTIRSLCRNPKFFVASSVCLALGIGTTTTVLAVVDSLYLSPPAGVSRPDEVSRVLIFPTRSVSGSSLPGLAHLVSYPRYRRLVRTISGIVIAGVSSATPMMQAVDVTRRVEVQLVSETYFDVLGVRPSLGRLIGSADAGAGRGEPVVVLSHELWRRRFGGRSDVIGHTMRLDGRSFTIVGVASEGFNGVDGGLVDMWLPLEAASQVGFQPEILDTEKSPWIEVITRQPAGMSSARLSLLITRAARGTADGHDAGNGTASQVRLSRIGAPLVQAEWANPEGADRASSLIFALSVFSGLLLLIACLNVANLFLVRNVQRHGEIAMRVALGARPRHIAGILLKESIVVAAVGGGVGLVLARWGQWLIRLLPGQPQPYIFGGRTAAVCVVVTLIAAAIAGMLPLARMLRTSRVGELRVGSSTGGRLRGRTQRILLVLQVGLAFALLVGAGLLLRSVAGLQSLKSGMAMDNLLVVSRDPFAMRAGQKVNWEAVLQPVRDHIAQLGGVEGVSVAMGAPFHTTFNAAVRRAGAPQTESFHVRFDAADTGYFRIIGVTLLRGRAFSTEDMLGDGSVAVVNDAFARVLWPNESPIGQCFQWEAGKSGCQRVIGVVANALYGSLTEPATPMFYVPLTSPGALQFRTLLVRTRESAAAAVGPVAAALSAMDASELDRFTVAPLSAAVAPIIETARLRARTLSWLSFAALVMVAAGLYGAVSYSMAQRVREIAIRMALGADARRVRRMVLIETLFVVGAGVCLGGIFALASSPIVSGLLFGVGRLDMVTYAAVVGLIVLTTLVAAYVPARAASGADPMEALRA